jgi:hypothetical protein
MSFFKSRTAAVVAGAAVLALAGGGAAVADKGGAGNPGHDHPGTLSDQVVINTEVRWSPDGDKATATDCPGDQVATGGGYEIDGTANGSAVDTEIVDNGPVYAAESGTASGWRVAGEPSGQVNVKVWVLCATVN